MKLSQFRSLIREEVRRMIRENKNNTKPAPQRRKQLKEAIQDGVTYFLPVYTDAGWDFSANELKAMPGKNPLQVGKAETKRLRRKMEDDSWDLYQLDSYMFMAIGEEGAFIVGTTQSPKYGQIWSMVEANKESAVQKMLGDMEDDVFAKGGNPVSV